MKILTIVLTLFLFTVPAFAFGKADTVKIALNSFAKDTFGNWQSTYLGFTFCERENIKIEFYKTNNSNLKKVVLTCLPLTIPVVMYEMTNKQANEFYIGIKGKYDCLTEDGISKCPKQEKE